MFVRLEKKICPFAYKMPYLEKKGIKTFIFTMPKKFLFPAIKKIFTTHNANIQSFFKENISFIWIHFPCKDYFSHSGLIQRYMLCSYQTKEREKAVECACRKCNDFLLTCFFLNEMKNISDRPRWSAYSDLFFL